MKTKIRPDDIRSIYASINDLHWEISLLESVPILSYDDQIKMIHKLKSQLFTLNNLVEMKIRPDSIRATIIYMIRIIKSPIPKENIYHQPLLDPQRIRTDQLMSLLSRINVFLDVGDVISGYNRISTITTIPQELML